MIINLNIMNLQISPTNETEYDNRMDDLENKIRSCGYSDLSIGSSSEEMMNICKIN